MGRHIKYTQKTIEKLRNEGRGKGSGSDYTPWIQVDDFPSLGRCHRIKDIYNGRIHHFFSDLEMYYYHILLWNESITDIREQFPLLPERTFNISLRLGCRHPTNPDQSLYIMTTDFLITHTNPLTKESTLTARSVKPESALASKRTCEKLQMEQMYWTEQGISWKCITEKSFSLQKAKNIRKITRYYDNTGSTYHTELTTNLLSLLLENQTDSLSSVCNKLDTEFHLVSGDSLALFYHLAAHRKIHLNLEQQILPAFPIENFIDISSLQALYDTESKVIKNEYIS